MNNGLYLEHYQCSKRIKSKREGIHIPSLFYWNCQEIQGLSFKKKEKKKKSSPSGSSFQVKFIWSSNEAHLILGRMYLKLHRDVSGAASWRTRCYVPTLFREQHWRLYGKNSIKNNRHWTEKTPFYSMPPAFCLKNTAKNHQKRLSIAIFMAIYGRLWQLKSYCNIGTSS